MASDEHFFPRLLQRNVREFFYIIRDRTAFTCFERKPIERMWTKREQIGELADARESRLPKQLDRHSAFVGAQIKLNALNESRKISDDQDCFVLVLAEERQHLGVFGREQFECPAAECGVFLPQRDDPLHPPPE